MMEVRCTEHDIIKVCRNKKTQMAKIALLAKRQIFEIRCVRRLLFLCRQAISIGDNGSQILPETMHMRRVFVLDMKKDILANRGMACPVLLLS